MYDATMSYAVGGRPSSNDGWQTTSVKVNEPLRVAGDREGQRPLRAVDGGGGITHLLVEDDQRGPVLQFLFRCRHAAAENCQNGFEHLVAPCYEHRS